MKNFPKTITPTYLHELDNIVMSHEVCERYNSHTALLNEIDRLNHEKKIQSRFKIGRFIFEMICIISLMSLICYMK